MSSEAASEQLVLLGAGGDITLVLTGPGGQEQARIRLSRQSAGALGGQLLSAAHEPLQASYTVTGIPEPEEHPEEPPEGSSEGHCVAVTPSVIATRAKSMPPPAPSTVTAWSSHLPDVDDELSGPWRFTQSALDNLSKHRLSREEAIAIAEEPATIVPADYGGGSNHIRNGVGVLVPPDDPRLIIAVFREETSGTAMRPRGGAGRRKPGTFAELKRLLEEHGFTVTNGTGHPKAHHPAHPGQIVLPGTPSDHRSYENTVADIRRRTGIDITKGP